MRYIIRFSYDGTNYYGYQKQNSYKTIEETIEKCVSYINRQTDTQIVASGRTDKGVHAYNQVAHFDLSIDIPLYKIKMALNSMLPDDIHIKEVKKVDDDFHARYMVKEKEYIYKVNVGEYDPINRNYCYQYCKNLNIDKMISAASIFIGTHDFRSFISAEDKRENSIRTIYDINVSMMDSIITFTFRGNGFMKYQVRNIVGSLIEVGNGKKNQDDLIKIMECRERNKAGFMAPACGLYLNSIKY